MFKLTFIEEHHYDQLFNDIDVNCSDKLINRVAPFIERVTHSVHQNTSNRVKAHYFHSVFGAFT